MNLEIQSLEVSTSFIYKVKYVECQMQVATEKKGNESKLSGGDLDFWLFSYNVAKRKKKTYASG